MNIFMKFLFFNGKLFYMLQGKKEKNSMDSATAQESRNYQAYKVRKSFFLL